MPELALQDYLGQTQIVPIEQAWMHFFCCMVKHYSLTQMGWWASEIVEAHGA